MKRLAAIVLGCALAACATLVAAQAQPQSRSPVETQLASAPFRVVAPFPPGGPVDTLARIVAVGLQARYGVGAVVDNRAGANGNLGIDAVKHAAPDGHTLLVVPAGNLTINPTLMPKLGYTVDGDFVPVSTLAKTPNVLAVNAQTPYRSVSELVAASKARPDVLAYASPGVGSGLHLAGELFKQQSGAELLHVPYKGTPPGLNDVLGGQVAVIFGNLPTLLPHVRSGKLRALAITDNERTALLPDVPTLAQAGVPGVVVTSWYGLLAPRGTPPAVVAQLARDLRQLFGEASNVAALNAQGMVVWLVPEAAFGEVIHAESATWAHVIKARNIQPE